MNDPAPIPLSREAHAAGMAHCDFKPENIMFTTAACEAVKVIDFGSACSEKQKFFDYIQSRFYRAPEVIRGSYTEKCDVWSIGVICYLLLCGKVPFTGDSVRTAFAMPRAG